MMETGETEESVESDALPEGRWLVGSTGSVFGVTGHT